MHKCGKKILERASAALLPVHSRAQTILIGRLRRAVSTVFEGQIAAVYESCNISAYSVHRQQQQQRLWYAAIEHGTQRDSKKAN
jgi:hypothetical protein